MNSSKLGLIRSIAVMLSLAISAQVAVGMKSVGIVITGLVTVLSGGDALMMYGHVYYVSNHIPNASAVREALRLLPRDALVDVVLDGPADSSASAVLSVALHAGNP